MTQEMPGIGEAEGSVARPARGAASMREGVDAEVARIIELAQAEGLQLTGEGGLLPGMIRQAVEAALNAEMSGFGLSAARRRGARFGQLRNGLYR